MIGAPHIDHEIEPTLKLVEVVGDIGRKIGVLAVFALYDTVFFVAESTRAEPFRAVLDVDVAARLEPCDRAFD